MQINRYILIGLTLVAHSASADQIADSYRLQVAEAQGQATKAHYEAQLLKDRARQAKRNLQRSKANLRAYVKMCEAEARLYQSEIKAHEYGLESPSYQWNSKREYGDTVIRIKGGS